MMVTRILKGVPKLILTLLVAVVLYSHAAIVMMPSAALAHPLDPSDVIAIVAAQRYPASFGDVWYSFALALFATATMSCVSLGMIIENAHMIREYRIKHTDPAHIYMRIQMAGFWVIFFGAGGDAVSLLCWGDVTPGTMEIILAVDRYMDFVAFVPFLYYIYLRTRSQPITLYYLKNNPPAETRPTFEMVRRNVGMVGIIATAALVVAITK